MSSFQQTLAEHFPNAIPEADFVARTYTALLGYGFHKLNTLACVAVCRDEITRPLVDHIHKNWGHSFDLASLGGMIVAGKTGFNAAHHHAPNLDGRERYVYYALAHIAIGPAGEIGVCTRPNRNGVSVACGALQAFLKAFLAEAETGDKTKTFDFEDSEQSFLRRRLLPAVEALPSPGLLDVTRLAYQAILEDLERMIALTVHTDHADYAVLSGIQVHGAGHNFVWPGTLYAVVNAERIALSLA